MSFLWLLKLSRRAICRLPSWMWVFPSQTFLISFNCTNWQWRPSCSSWLEFGCSWRTNSKTRSESRYCFCTTSALLWCGCWQKAIAFPLMWWYAFEPMLRPLLINNIFQDEIQRRYGSLCYFPLSVFLQPSFIVLIKWDKAWIKYMELWRLTKLHS